MRESPSFQSSIFMLSFAVVILSLDVAAQRTWIVDQANGPGTNFTDIPMAIAAAAPGDNVIVRAGSSYSGFLLGKPLQILAEPNVSVQAFSISPGALIANLPAGGEIVLDGFLKCDVYVNRCAGSVFIQNIGCDRAVVTNSAAVTFAGCRLGSGSSATFMGARVDGSVVTYDRCRILGGCAGFGGATGVGLEVLRSTVVSSRTSIVGGAPCQLPAAASAAIRLGQSVLTLTGDGSARVAPGQPGPNAIEGTGTVIMSPLVSVNGAVASSVAVVSHHVPSLAASAAGVGQPRVVDLRATSGAYFLLALGYPGTPTRLAGTLGDLWLDPARPLALFAAGFVPPSGRIVHRLPGAMNPSLVGVRVAWQAAAFEQGVLTLSNAAGYALLP